MAFTLPPIGLQLYTIRDAFADDPEGSLARVAAMGYAGVEPFPEAFEALPPTRLRERCEALGLALPSCHLPLPTGVAAEPVLALARDLGVRRIVVTLGPDAFDGGRLDATLDAFGQAAGHARDAGFGFAIHNHWWEFEGGDDAPYKRLAAELPADVDFEVDSYWVQVAGLDPAAVLRELAERAPLLHLKDGPATFDDAMVALGEGVIDLPTVIAAAQNPEWLIVELDRCDSDMMTAVEASFDYLTGAGLGRGR